MFFSLALSFIFLSSAMPGIAGESYGLLIVLSAAAETSIGLAILLVNYRLGHQADYDSLLTLRG